MSLVNFFIHTRILILLQARSNYRSSHSASAVSHQGLPSAVPSAAAVETIQDNVVESSSSDEIYTEPSDEEMSEDGDSTDIDNAEVSFEKILYFITY